jgi:membrane-associated phospholipid phosphatase
MPASNCSATTRYNLTGPQVEPAAGYWNHCAQLRMVNVEELTSVTDDQGAEFKTAITGTGTWGYFPPYDPKKNEQEMQELLFLAQRRDAPECLVDEKPNSSRRREKISKFFGYMPFALGAVQVTRLPCDDSALAGSNTCVSVIRTGRGLARAVEAETPGIFHRHALNLLILQRSWSPPRQALIWGALDMAIASALQSAWYYKWLAAVPKGGSTPRPFTSFRPRPYECNNQLLVLFDFPDELNPLRAPCPTPSPGTPRHPAYPSGHSTYAAAASEVLAFFFGEEIAEFSRLADNIGIGRLWAGIHWRSDHTAGQKLGRTVGQLIIRQLLAMGIEHCPPEPEPQPILPCPPGPGLIWTTKCPQNETKPPTSEELAKQAQDFAKKCRDGDRTVPKKIDFPPGKKLPKPCQPKKARGSRAAGGPPGQSVQAGAL